MTDLQNAPTEASQTPELDHFRCDCTRAYVAFCGTPLTNPPKPSDGTCGCVVCADLYEHGYECPTCESYWCPHR